MGVTNGRSAVTAPGPDHAYGRAAIFLLALGVLLLAPPDARSLRHVRRLPFDLSVTALATPAP